MTITETTITYASTIDPALTALEAILTRDSAASNRPLLVVLHGFSGVATSFDANTRARMASGLYLTITPLSGVMVKGETATSGGASCVVYGVSAGNVTARPTAGTFAEGATLTGATSGATARIDALYVTNLACLFVELRGRNGTSGTPDAGARELYDILDAVRAAIAAYPALIDPAQLHFAGYSGGGANGMSMAAKFPDLFTTIACYFGISDYGYDPVYGWYAWGAGAGDLTNLLAWVGGPPSTHLVHYRARLSKDAVSNRRGGMLHLYHDDGDLTVPSFNSERVAERLDAMGLSDLYTISITTTGDDPRWQHGYPNLSSFPDITLAEVTYMQAIDGKARAAFTVEAAGALIVAGYVVTKRFEFWAGDGTADYAMLSYDTVSNVYTVTSMSGAFDWELVLLGQTPDAEVTITVDGIEYTATVGDDGRAAYGGSVVTTEATGLIYLGDPQPDELT